MTIFNKIAPALRFKGFDDIWNILTLGDLGSFKNGLNKESKDFGFGSPFVNLMDVFGKTILEETDFGLVNANKKDIEIYSLKKGDVLFIRSSVKRSGVGETILVAKDLPNTVYSGFLIRFRDRNKELDLNFKSYCFSNIPFRNELLSYATSSANTNINQDSLSQIKLHFPSLPEQQKIASFLSAIDEKIQQLKRKKELLEQYKKGVMQQLFSGKLRFKDENGKVYPKWEKKLYEDIFSFYTTNSLSRENLNYESGTIKNIHYGDIHTKFSSRFKLSEELVPYINQDVDLSKLNVENYCQEGDLVIADASEDYADIGKTIELIKLNGEKVVAGLHTFLARPNKMSMYKGFSGYLVQAPYVRKQIMTIAQGTKVLSLSSGRLGKIKLDIPVIKEQQKIASYLSAIDSKIEGIMSQIIHTQIFKKGLLQQMFV